MHKRSIHAINPPEKITGGFSFLVSVRNDSGRLWESAIPNPINLCYHWLDEEWSMVVFDGKRTKLPEGGIPPGGLAEFEVEILPPPEPGLYRLHLTLVEEGISWFDLKDQFSPQILEIQFAPIRFSGDWGPDLRRRIEMTTSCRDCDAIPKHPEAGRVQEFQGQKIQVMHEGTRVVAGGYYGGWMQDIIENLCGHHEPQEELAFYHLLKRLPQGALMIEAGAFWAYYSNWFLGAVPDSRAICIEPDENNLRIGETNAILNGRSAEFHVGCIGARNLAEMAFHRESDHSEVRIPCFNWDGVARLANEAFVDLLHIDSQGAELLFFSSLPEEKCADALRFVVVSTHHASISGSATTHRDCLLELVRRGAVILCEHTVEESFSGDGLIVASFFPEDAAKPLPQVKRNAPEKSLFGKDPIPQPATVSPNLPAGQIPAHALRVEQPVQAKSDLGPIWVMPSDTAIGASLLATGRFEERVIEDVTTFLSERYGFIPEQFVDVGANIGTHLLHALRSGLFKTGVAFEADPLNYDLLVRNIRLAGLEDQVRAFHFPISDRTGAVTIERAPDNLGDHRVRVAESSTSEFYQESQRETISLVSETLDNLNAEFQLGFAPQTLFWIDTQGHEGHVFGGAKGLLEQGALEYVVTEFWPYGLERAGGKEKFFDFLSSCSAIYDLRQPDWQNAELLSPKDLLKKYNDLIAQGINHTDLLCVHGSANSLNGCSTQADFGNLVSILSRDTQKHLSDNGAISKMTTQSGKMRPLMIIVETINVCNSECVFCPYTLQTRPKGVMSEDLFSRILEEYIELGGGAISLTPMVGDVLLDRKLMSRMDMLRKNAEFLTPSITTNLYALGRYSDKEVLQMLTTLERIHISCYGITRDENRAITKKDHYEVFCTQMNRLLRLKTEFGGKAELALGFRTIYDYSSSQLIKFQQETFGQVLSVTCATATYANWGNSMRGSLPGHARWCVEKENFTTCILLAIALQIYHDGRVSACACCDYNASPELTLGSLSEETLCSLLNNNKNQLIWKQHQAGNLPQICRQCTFHSPLSGMTSQHPVLNKITDFIGG